MTETQTQAEPLAPYEVNRLLRAFHSDIADSEKFQFQCKGTVRNTMEFVYAAHGVTHRVEVGDDFISHSMRQGVTEVKTDLRVDKDTQQISIKRQRRDFDFKTGELGEPVDVPIENMLQENHDLNHMAHVAMRTAQAIQSKGEGKARG